MDSSDEDIVLLSTMSPVIKNKLKPGQKRFRRVAGASILALKRNIRRSSLYENSVITPKNEELNLADSRSTTESCDSEKWNILNKTPIIISDTDEETEEDDEKVQNDNGNCNLRNCSLSNEKMNDIQCWIHKVNAEENCTLSTVFSELSTIQGDTYLPEGIGKAVNSTLATPLCKRFDELFKNNTNLKDPNESLISTSEKIEVLQSLENLVIEDSFDEPYRNLETPLSKPENERTNDISSSPKATQGSDTNLTEPKNPIHDDLFSSPKESNEKNEDMENMLDTLYGHSWRAKKELVLPKTEPRKNKLNFNHFQVTKSERKPKLSLLYKNPYLDSVGPRTLDTPFKLSLQDSLIARVKLLCDSDTSSANSPVEAVPKMKLSFNSNITDDDDEVKTSKYFKNSVPGKTHLHVSPDITDDDEENEKDSKQFERKSERSENRIHKKTMRFEVPSSTNGKIGKIYAKSDKENIETPLKKIRKPKNTFRKQQSRSSSCSDDNSFKTARTTVSKNKDNKMNLNHSSVSLTSDEEWEKEISKIDHSTSLVNGTYSFLTSLSKSTPLSKCDMSARIYRNNFKNFRDQLTKKLFVLYNVNIFDNSIPKDTVLEWNDRLLNTAGQCYCKKIIRRCGQVERTVRIVLSAKVLDSAERLRDTLVHEMCHAATWIVNCVSDGHGSYWKAWAYKAMKTYPELPPISRCHNYVINTKYTYKCTGCGYSIGRHTKSLDVERKRCGYCHGKFEVLINKTTKKGTTKSVPATPKKEATGFALFVKENYGIYKTPEVKHADVMKLLGQKFQEMKLKS